MGSSPTPPVEASAMAFNIGGVALPCLVHWLILPSVWRNTSRSKGADSIVTTVDVVPLCHHEAVGILSGSARPPATGRERKPPPQKLMNDSGIQSTGAGVGSPAYG